MKSSKTHNSFELESLEPRILLSGEGLIAPTLLDNSDSPLTPFENLFESSSQAEEILLPLGESLQNRSSYGDDSYDPADRIDDLFADLNTGEFTPDELNEGAPDGDTDTESDLPEPPVNQSNDPEISATEEAVITQGMTQLARVVALLEVANEMLTAQLPFVESASAGSLIGLSETIDTRLKIPVFDYFNDGVDPPSLNGAKLIIEQNSDDYDSYDFSLNSLKGTYSAVDGEICFDLQANVTRSGLLRLDAESLNQTGITLAEETTAYYTATIELDVSFGVGAADTETGQTEFFLVVHQLDASLSIIADDIDASVSLAELPVPVEVVDGKVQIEADLSIQIGEELSADGRITLDELAALTPENINDFVNLTLSGSLTVELPLVLFAEINSGSGNQPIIFADSNLFQEFSFQNSLEVFSGTLKNSLLNILNDLIKVKSAAPEMFSDASADETDEPVVDEYDSEEAGFDQDATVESKPPSVETPALTEKVDPDQQQPAAENDSQQDGGDNAAIETTPAEAGNQDR
ncbi:MAG: LEPR-XLL domain-containing protein, partial [Desulfuromonadales bacterium]|nr:LEPR-XLL domain-containing protein [Desulfuromonadales bacterium]